MPICAGDLVVSGDLNRGHLVHSTPYRFERSDDYAFANDQASFRGVWRLNGRIRDTKAIGAVAKHSLCLEYPDVNFFPTCETANGRCAIAVSSASSAGSTRCVRGSLTVSGAG
jgi:hypothetical protein